MCGRVLMLQTSVSPGTASTPAHSEGRSRATRNSRFLYVSSADVHATCQVGHPRPLRPPARVYLCTYLCRTRLLPKGAWDICSCQCSGRWYSASAAAPPACRELLPPAVEVAMLPPLASASTTVRIRGRARGWWAGPASPALPTTVPPP